MVNYFYNSRDIWLLFGSNIFASLEIVILKIEPNYFMWFMTNKYSLPFLYFILMHFAESRLDTIIENKIEVTWKVTWIPYSLQYINYVKLPSEKQFKHVSYRLEKQGCPEFKKLKVKLQIGNDGIRFYKWKVDSTQESTILKLTKYA